MDVDEEEDGTQGRMSDHSSDKHAQKIMFGESFQIKQTITNLK